MKDHEVQERMRSLDKVAKRVLSSRSQARKFLVEAGICTPDGKLAKPYRG